MRIEIIGTIRIRRLQIGFSLAYAKPPHFDMSLFSSVYVGESHDKSVGVFE